MSSMLSRFRKPGGFIQLLALIEGCDPEKQSSLLNLVGNEDPGWANLVKIKALSLERILGWPLDVLIRITPHLSEKVHLAALVGMNEMQKQKWIQAIPAQFQKDVVQALKDRPPSLAEFQTAALRVVKVVRDLELQGILKLIEFDPVLDLDKRLVA